MDLQKLITESIKQRRDAEMTYSPQLILGKAIEALKSADLTYPDDKASPHKHVYFDFGTMTPVGLSSWRGSYDELAIEYADGGSYTLGGQVQAPTGTEFLVWLEGAVGKTYQGWKGGDFVMSESTPLWVANQGNSGETALVAVEVGEYGILLRTWAMEYLA